MDELLETVTTAENAHESFRIWITTEAHPQFPISLLQVSTCLVSSHSYTNKSWTELLETPPNSDFDYLVTGSKF